MQHYARPFQRFERRLGKRKRLRGRQLLLLIPLALLMEMGLGRMAPGRRRGTRKVMGKIQMTRIKMEGLDREVRIWCYRKACDFFLPTVFQSLCIIFNSN